MRSQACEPCAKRKVRCDRVEPCSNCKRRKQDVCRYREPSPTDRIRRLEGIVPSATPFLPEAPVARPPPNLPPAGQHPPGSSGWRSTDPVILEADGQQQYIESRAWLVYGHRQAETRAEIPLLPSAPSAFQGIFAGQRPYDSAVIDHLRDSAPILWTTFKQRVHPFNRLCFSWDLERLESANAFSAPSQPANDAQDALIASIYLAAVVSLTGAECEASLQRSRCSLLPDCQALCEASLARTNILCMQNIVALKAMAIYMWASLDRVSSQSLWTLMGLAIRNGEKLGIQRDGTTLGLSPIETEEHRRLWWQLQYLDMILAVRLGATPSTLTANWDAKLPLNIEDEDLIPASKSLPPERKGLSSLSYCLFTFYVLDEQRRYHADKGKFEMSWSTNQSVSNKVKDVFISQLEDGLNQKFLQYCDPVEPLHVLLHIMARALICTFRQRILLTGSGNSGPVDEEHRPPLLALSMRLLEYSLAFHSNRLLKCFAWLTSNGFPWPAFMVVLVEASRETDPANCQGIWALLSDLYDTNTSLLELAGDRRRLHAAELIVAAWKACRSKGTMGRSLPKPSFVSKLEERLKQIAMEPAQAPVAGEVGEGKREGEMRLDMPSGVLGEEDFNFSLDLNFEDIDWAFWNNFD